MIVVAEPVKVETLGGKQGDGRSRSKKTSLLRSVPRETCRSGGMLSFIKTAIEPHGNSNLPAHPC